MKTEPIQCGTQGFAEQMVMKIKLPGICDKLAGLAHAGITQILLLPIGTFLIILSNNR
jgi:hypothetical protein